MIRVKVLDGREQTFETIERMMAKLKADLLWDEDRRLLERRAARGDLSCVVRVLDDPYDPEPKFVLLVADDEDRLRDRVEARAEETF